MSTSPKDGAKCPVIDIATKVVAWLNAIPREVRP